jgi:glycyl-tRNA synthetase beta chain
MNLVFEIGCEEIPARFVDRALDDMGAKFAAECEARRVGFDGFRTFGTPRRMTLLVEGLAERQDNLEEVRTGPPERAAFRDGEPTKAAHGFARGAGVAVEDLTVVETPKGRYVAANVFQEGRPTRELLPEILLAILNGLGFPKSMRWADNREAFARPVRWILALAGTEVVPLTWAKVESGAATQGHRFVAPGPFEISGDDPIPAYLATLEGANVVLDPAERRRLALDGLQAAAEAAGGQLRPDPGLLTEVSHLVESPYICTLEFDEKYLELPDEVLISSMRSHQRYFAITDAEGALLNACGVVYNTPVRDVDVVRRGNLRVLRARLEDAVFFWETDLATPLPDRLSKLENVVWLKQIGSVRQRCERISTLAAAIAVKLGFDDETQANARRAGLLSKADLVTNLVGEFPDLQGAVGREYARKAGEDDAVAVAIYEQYLPRGAEDAIPQTDAGAAVALAEKLDALVGCFGIGLVPSSNADPYALRRAAIGVLRILVGRQYTTSLPELVVVDAVLAVGLDDVLSAGDRVTALTELVDEPDFEPLATGFRRVVNILRKQAADRDAAGVDPGLFVDDAERSLHGAYISAAETMDAALDARDWSKACGALIGLKSPVDTFFDEVMVMADDPGLRGNRIALLASLEQLFLKVADISVISVSR